MRLLSRAAAAIAAVTLLAACGSSGTPGTGASGSGAQSGSAPTTSLTLGLVQGQDFTFAMPARVAEAQGIFTRHGLNVKVVAFSAGSDLVKALASGSIDVGHATGLDVTSAAANGVDTRAFYGSAEATPMGLIATANSPMTSFADMKGKKIGISKFGSLTDYYVKLTAQSAGLSSGDVTEVPLGTPAGNLAALQRGDVDGVMLPVTFAFTLQSKGGGKLVERVSDVVKESQYAVLMASSKWLQNQTAAKALAASFAESIQWMKDNKQGTVHLAMSRLGMANDVAGKTYDALVPDFTPDGTINLAGLAAFAQALPGLKLAPSTPAQDTYYTGAFIPVTG